MNGLSPSDPNTFLQCLLALFTEEWFDVPINSSVFLYYFGLQCSNNPLVCSWTLSTSLTVSWHDHLVPSSFSFWEFALPSSNFAPSCLSGRWFYSLFLRFSSNQSLSAFFFFFGQNLLSNTEEKLKNSSFDNFTLSKWVKVYHNGW